MAFYGLCYIYDDIPSEQYGLQIINLETGLQEGNAGGASNIIEDYQIHRNKAYFYKTVHNIPLEFDFTVGSGESKGAVDRDIINRWMLSRSGYKKLQIVQDDMIDVYYNVIFQEAAPLYAGNLMYAIRYSAHCDSGFGWTFPKTVSVTGGTGIINRTLSPIINDGAADGYVYPTLTFTMNSLGGTVAITNISDSSRVLIITGLLSSETITIDNDNRIITSSMGRLSIDKFNGNWFRLIGGINSININGAITNLSMTYELTRKMGV